MDTEYSIYLGQEQKNGFTGFLAEKNFFCVVEIFDGYTNEQGEQLMSALAEVGTTDFPTLSAFDSVVSELFKRFNIPLDTSIAIGYKKNTVLYLKTVGSGEVYIGRGKSFERIIQGTVNASGKFQKDDLYVFTTSFFTQSLKGIQHTKSLFHKHISLRDFPEQVKRVVGGEDDTGAVALFAKIVENKKNINEETETVVPTGTVTEKIKNRLRSFTSAGKKKKIAIGLVIILCIGIFGWNTMNKFQTKGIRSGQSQSYDDQKQKVESSLEQASLKTDSIAEGVQLLSNARATVTLMKKSASADKQQELASLEKKITDTESTLLKRTYKEPQEYYDFAVEEKNARGTKISVFDDKAAILNPAGKVYILALEKKSITTVSLPKKVVEDSFVGGYEANSYVLDPQSGMMRFDNLGKGAVVIPKETQWGSITSFSVYNGNVYMLDGTNNALYKYPVAAAGYGDRTSYFKGSFADMDAGSTFAIDVSVYIATKAMVTKYTAGLADDFKFSLPGENGEITKVITHPDQTNIYLWDKKNGTLSIASRDGVYQGQVASSLFSQATDVEVYNNKAFLLKDAKLYSIDL